MREWVLYKNTACQVINNASFNAENIRIEYIYKVYPDKTRQYRTYWVPVAECTPITKEVADIIISSNYD